MTFALFLLLSESAVSSEPLAAPPAAEPAAVARTYDAIVATEETPALEDLTQPAILDRDSRIERVSTSDPRAIV